MNSLKTGQYEPVLKIPNMNQFYKQSIYLLENMENKKYAMIALDVDNFKVVNELYGLEKGDAILEVISDFIGEYLLERGCYARVYSDEFCILKEYEKDAELTLFISKLTSKFYERQFGFELKPSFGIYRIEDVSLPIRTMFDRACMAKKTIKGNLLQFFAYYEDKLRIDMLKENQIGDNIGEALGSHQFVMYLQPKYSIESGRPVGAEALVRWVHPERGMISPNDFIPLFEKNGFVVILDEFIWEEAVKALKEWKDKGYLPIPISINISRLHFRDRNFVKTLTDLTDSYGIPRHLLELEVTESAFLNNHGNLLTIMKELRNLGFRLDMDDFGSGYSSLNLLKSAPIDVIKLDQIFLSEEVTTAKGKIVIRSIINMAKEMGIRVIAEGVETKEKADFLLKSGCYLAQGYYYSKPLNKEEFEKKVFEI